MGHHKLINSFIAALQGITFAVRRERNMRFHLLAAVLVVGAAAYFRLEKLELLFVFMAVFLVLITEMVNTALEKAVDLSTRKYNELAHAAKNVAAGAVLFAALFALVVAWIVFAEKFAALWK